MITKKILPLSLASLCFVSVSMLAHADLQITNNTNHASTAVINHGDCSSILLGSAGITEAHKSTRVSDWGLWWACKDSPHDCIADVYMTTDCAASGTKVATVLFDTIAGIQSVANFSNEYLIKKDDNFSIELDDGNTFAYNYYYNQGY